VNVAKRQLAPREEETAGSVADFGQAPAREIGGAQVKRGERDAAGGRQEDRENVASFAEGEKPAYRVQGAEQVGALSSDYLRPQGDMDMSLRGPGFHRDKAPAAPRTKVRDAVGGLQEPHHGVLKYRVTECSHPNFDATQAEPFKSQEQISTRDPVGEEKENVASFAEGEKPAYRVQGAEQVGALSSDYLRTQRDMDMSLHGPGFHRNAAPATPGTKICDAAGGRQEDKENVASFAEGEKPAYRVQGAEQVGALSSDYLRTQRDMDMSLRGPGFHRNKTPAAPRTKVRDAVGGLQEPHHGVLKYRVTECSHPNVEQDVDFFPIAAPLLKGQNPTGVDGEPDGRRGEIPRTSYPAGRRAFIAPGAATGTKRQARIVSRVGI